MSVTHSTGRLVDVDAVARRIPKFRGLAGSTILDVLESGRESIGLLEELEHDATLDCDLVLDTQSTRLLPPISRPPRIFCIGRNYAAHAAEGNNEVPDFPMLFLKPATSIIGHCDPIVIPHTTDKVDWEVELVIVIGKSGRYIPEDDAESYIAGYTIANDVSARDWQRRTSQFDIGKMFDTFCPLGPEFVSADALSLEEGLDISTLLNGQTMQQGSTRDMVFSPAYLVAYLSQTVRLRPGDLILTGTPDGVGFARNPPVYLKHGDRLDLTIQGIGTLTNPVVAEQLYTEDRTLEW